MSILHRMERDDLMKKKKQGKRRRWWKIPLAILLLIIFLAGAYIAYVFFSYSRIEDKKALTVQGNADQAASVNREYTIVSYNIGFGAYTSDFTFFMDGGKESRARSKDSVVACVEGTTKTALSFKPDFAFFQEVDTDSTRSFHVDQAAMITESFDEAGAFDSVFAQNYHSAYLMYPLLKPHGASNSGLLTLSRADIDSSLRRSLPITTGLKKFLDLDRCYSISRIPLDKGKELILVNVHTSAYGTSASQGNAQMEMLFDDLSAEYERGNYVICGGDFNHDFTGTSREYFNPGTKDIFSWCQPFPEGLLPEGFSRCTDYAQGMVSTSRNTDIPYSRDSFVVILDGFIISDNVSCNYVHNMDTGYQYTDHNPVVMKFTLRR